MKKGFTMVELLAVMAILGLILIILIPNVIDTNNKTNVVINNSKIQTLKAKALETAEKKINDYNICQGTIMSVNTGCVRSATSVLAEIDPKDTTSIPGNIYICFNSSTLRLETFYSTSTSYNCKAGASGESDASGGSNAGVVVGPTYITSDKCTSRYSTNTCDTYKKLRALNSNIYVRDETVAFNVISPSQTRYVDNGVTGSESSTTPYYNTNNITYGSSYTFDQTTGRYTIVNPQVCQWSTCYSSLAGKYIGTTTLYPNTTLRSYNKVQSISQITSNSTSEKIYYKSLSRSLLSFDDSNSGMFSAPDDYGDSFYFRGSVHNNYVKFGKNKSGNEMYWRILRINGDGTLRLLYDGTSAHPNGESSTNRRIGTKAFNSGTGRPYDVGYVGYMYGTFTDPSGCTCASRSDTGGCLYTCTGGGSTSVTQAEANTNSSTIKSYLESWYLENISNTGYASYVADGIFCNDRTLRTTDQGYGHSAAQFGVYRRVASSKAPSLQCPRKQDAFTKSDSTKGNAKLTYPIGLITADEFSFGGLVSGGDYNYVSYLYKGYNYWSMSPYSSSTTGSATLSTGNVGFSNSATSTAVSVAPVINLTKAAVQRFTGNGTRTNPFTIS